MKITLVTLSKMGHHSENSCFGKYKLHLQHLQLPRPRDDLDICNKLLTSTSQNQHCQDCMQAHAKVTEGWPCSRQVTESCRHTITRAFSAVLQNPLCCWHRPSMSSHVFHGSIIPANTGSTTNLQGRSRRLLLDTPHLKTGWRAVQQTAAQPCAQATTSMGSAGGLGLPLAGGPIDLRTERDPSAHSLQDYQISRPTVSVYAVLLLNISCCSNSFPPIIFRALQALYSLRGDTLMISPDKSSTLQKPTYGKHPWEVPIGKSMSKSIT